MKIIGIVFLILCITGLSIFVSMLTTSIAEEALADMPEGPEKERIRMEMLLAQHNDQHIF